MLRSIFTLGLVVSVGALGWLDGASPPAPRAHPVLAVAARPFPLAPARQVVTPPPALAADSAVSDAELDAGIHASDATHHAVTRALYGRLLRSPMWVAKSARIVPALTDGRPSGFKLYAVRPGSALQRVGLENGDLIASINGANATSGDEGLRVYAELRTAAEIRIQVVRHGAPITLTIAILGVSDDELTTNLHTVD